MAPRRERTSGSRSGASKDAVKVRCLRHPRSRGGFAAVWNGCAGRTFFPPKRVKWRPRACAAADPRSGLHAMQRPPPFLQKTWEMLEEKETDGTVSWSEDGKSFIVWRPDVLQNELLPKYFKHQNYSSFVRQLNTYGFRKVNPDRWEFAQEHFRRDDKDRMVQIVRKRPSKKEAAAGAGDGSGGGNAGILLPGGAHSAVPPIEVGNFGGLDQEFDRMKRDNSVLTMELLRMRQEQQQMRQEMAEMRSRQDHAESVQSAMMNYALQDPYSFKLLLERYQNAKGMKDSSSRKRRALEQGEQTAAADAPRSTSLMLRDQPQSFYEGAARGPIIEPVSSPSKLEELDDADDAIMTPAARNSLRQQGTSIEGGGIGGMVGAQLATASAPLEDTFAAISMGKGGRADGAGPSRGLGLQEALQMQPPASVPVHPQAVEELSPDDRLMSLGSVDNDLLSALLEGLDVPIRED